MSTLTLGCCRTLTRARHLSLSIAWVAASYNFTKIVFHGDVTTICTYIHDYAYMTINVLSLVARFIPTCVQSLRVFSVEECTMYLVHYAYGTIRIDLACEYALCIEFNLSYTFDLIMPRKCCKFSLVLRNRLSPTTIVADAKTLLAIVCGHHQRSLL